MLDTIDIDKIQTKNIVIKKYKLVPQKVIDYLYDAEKTFLESDISTRYKKVLDDMNIHIRVVNKVNALWAGKCILWPNHKIDLLFNASILDRCKPDDHRDTVIHELGHAIQFKMRGKSDHGMEWKKICKAAGGTAAIRHKYPLYGLRKYKYIAVENITEKEYLLNDAEVIRLLRCPLFSERHNIYRVKVTYKYGKGE
jgi:hypothetical protein